MPKNWGWWGFKDRDNDYNGRLEEKMEINIEPMTWLFSGLNGDGDNGLGLGHYHCDCDVYCNGDSYFNNYFLDVRGSQGPIDTCVQPFWDHAQHLDNFNDGAHRK